MYRFWIVILHNLLKDSGSLDDTTLLNDRLWGSGRKYLPFRLRFKCIYYTIYDDTCGLRNSHFPSSSACTWGLQLRLFQIQIQELPDTAALMSHGVVPNSTAWTKLNTCGKLNLFSAQGRM